jgi:hypothetical protein
MADVNFGCRNHFCGMKVYSFIHQAQVPNLFFLTGPERIQLPFLEINQFLLLGITDFFFWI